MRQTVQNILLRVILIFLMPNIAEAQSVEGVFVVTQKFLATRTVEKADITVRNGHNYAIKDIEVECSFFGPSGTKISSRKETLFEVIGPQTTRTFRSVELGFVNKQRSTGSCDVVRAERVIR